MHSEDVKAVLEKNKRTLKTRAQRQALEEFYNEHKYPSESMKIEVAESSGLTEKHVSEWFCHRRLKAKKSMSGKIHASRPMQDSCGSTILANKRHRNSETGKVKSGKELSDDASTESNSLLLSMPNNHNDNPINMKSSRCPMTPKFPLDVKGVEHKPCHLKLIRGATTAVEKMLGIDRTVNKHMSKVNIPSSKEIISANTSKTTDPTKDLVTTKPSQIVEGSSKRKRVDDVDGYDEFVRLKFPKNFSLFSDPGQLEGEVEKLIFPPDERKMKEFGLGGTCTHNIMSAFQTLQSSLQIRKNMAELADKVKSESVLNTRLRVDNAMLKMSETKLKKSATFAASELKRLQAELYIERKERANEQKKIEDLTAQLDSIAKEAVVKTRLEAMKEYKAGLHVKWNVDREIELLERFYKEDSDDNSHEEATEST